jgi:hypothetical protein
MLKNGYLDVHIPLLKLITPGYMCCDKSNEMTVQEDR